MLDPAYITACEQRARRFQATWDQGTSGSLAADSMRLLKERKELMAQLEEANKALRDAVADRLANTPADDPKMVGYSHPPTESCCEGGKCQPTVITSGHWDNAEMAAADAESQIPHDWILRGERELEEQRLRGDGVLNAGSDTYSEWRPAFQSPGTTAKFGTGAVRSDTFEEFRYDLVSPIGLREVARACAEGAQKYGDWNWEKGMPVHDLLNHAIAHIYQFLSGDRSEPHLGHAAWNLLAAIHSHELWPQLNYTSLRRPGCVAPDQNGP